MKRSTRRCVREGDALRCTEEIGSGDVAIDRTVRRMRRLARRDAKDPDIVELATTFDRDDERGLRELFDYVVAHMRYESDPADREYVKAPIHTLIKGAAFGDCDDMATALAALILAAPTRRRCWFRTIAWRKRAFTHVFLMVELPSRGIVIPLDPVMRERGFGNAKEARFRFKDYPV